MCSENVRYKHPNLLVAVVLFMFPYSQSESDALAAMEKKV